MIDDQLLQQAKKNLSGRVRPIKNHPHTHEPIKETPQNTEEETRLELKTLAGNIATALYGCSK